MARVKARPRNDPVLSAAWWEAVTKKGRAKCVVCEKSHPLIEGHHAVPQQVIRREFPRGAIFVGGTWEAVDRFFAVDESDPFRSLQQLLWDERNGIALCPADHEAHTGHARKVPRSKLPAAVFVFATELGLQHRLGPRYYAAS